MKPTQPQVQETSGRKKRQRIPAMTSNEKIQLSRRCSQCHGSILSSPVAPSGASVQRNTVTKKEFIHIGGESVVTRELFLCKECAIQEFASERNVDGNTMYSWLNHDMHCSGPGTGEFGILGCGSSASFAYNGLLTALSLHKAAVSKTPLDKHVVAAAESALIKALCATDSFAALSVTSAMTNPRGPTTKDLGLMKEYCAECYLKIHALVFPNANPVETLSHRVNLRSAPLCPDQAQNQRQGQDGEGGEEGRHAFPKTMHRSEFQRAALDALNTIDSLQKTKKTASAAAGGN